ncbi:hypothetical protein WN944_007347 [Citrus x changshan-huyou]|uniref:Defensin-like protein n=1 Tax=Citrus x changshan-huyou TaxID=2935761 RepID=A0AAP0QXZ3_9ROSI
MYDSKDSFALIFLLLIAGTALLPAAKGKICIEDFGTPCSEGSCERTCESKHANGLGDCDVDESCKCFYDCEANPPRKLCKEDLGTTLLPVTKGKICIEDFGPNCSGGDCETKCESKHKNGLGDCDVGESCKCYYDCEAKPPRKLCKSDLGLYPRGCAAQQCQKDCENEFHEYSKEDVHGYCYGPDIYPDQSCRCAYFCPSFKHNG